MKDSWQVPKILNVHFAKPDLAVQELGSYRGPRLCVSCCQVPRSWSAAISAIQDSPALKRRTPAIPHKDRWDKDARFVSNDSPLEMGRRTITGQGYHNPLSIFKKNYSQKKWSSSICSKIPERPGHSCETRLRLNRKLNVT